MALNGNHSTSKWNTGPVDCIREMTAAIFICDRTYPPAEGSHLWFDLFHVTLCVFACRRCGLHTRHAYLIASGRGSKEKEKRKKFPVPLPLACFSSISVTPIKGEMIGVLSDRRWIFDYSTSLVLTLIKQKKKHHSLVSTDPHDGWDGCYWMCSFKYSQIK